MEYVPRTDYDTTMLSYAFFALAHRIKTHKLAVRLLRQWFAPWHPYYNIPWDEASHSALRYAGTLAIECCEFDRDDTMRPWMRPTHEQHVAIGKYMHHMILRRWAVGEEAAWDEHVKQHFS